MRRQTGLIENCEFKCKKRKMQETAKICNFQLKIVNFVATLNFVLDRHTATIKEARASRVFLYLVCFPGVLFRLDVLRLFCFLSPRATGSCMEGNHLKLSVPKYYCVS